MPTFPIHIDATQLVYRYFIIPGITNNWIDSRIVQTLALPPGTYNFQVASGYYADFTFDVTTGGLVNYASGYTFLSGSGTSTLTIAGFEVTLDARYLSGSGVLLVAPLTNADWITYKACRMVPASYYSVQQGSGEVADFTFELDLSGNFSYKPSYNIGSGGFLGGNGTSTLEFFGYPILVDARAANGEGLTIQPIWGMPFTFTAVQFEDLLPAPYFALQVNSGIVTTAVFSLDTMGNFTTLSTYLAFDTFNGLKRLKVIAAPLPTS